QHEDGPESGESTGVRDDVIEIAALVRAQAVAVARRARAQRIAPNLHERDVARCLLHLAARGAAQRAVLRVVARRPGVELERRVPGEVAHRRVQPAHGGAGAVPELRLFAQRARGIEAGEGGAASIAEGETAGR